MLDAAPAQVCQVQQTVNSAEVDESAVLGHVLDVTVHNLAFGKRFHQRGALGMQLFFEQRAPADHYVAAAAIQLGDANLNFLPEQIVEVLRWAQIELRAGKKRAYSDVDNQTTLDAVDYFAGDGILRLESGVDALPRAAAQHLLIRNNEVAFFVFAGALHFNGGIGLR